MASKTTDQKFEMAMKRAIQTVFTDDADDPSDAEKHTVETESASAAEQSRAAAAPAETVSLSSSVVFGLLADQRRRYVLYYLTGCTSPATLDEVTEQVAVWETETNATEIPDAVYERIHLELTNSHLPKLVDADVITYDVESQVLTLIEGSGQFEACLERVAASEHQHNR